MKRFELEEEERKVLQTLAKRGYLLPDSLDFVRGGLLFLRGLRGRCRNLDTARKNINRFARAV